MTQVESLIALTRKELYPLTHVPNWLETAVKIDSSIIDQHELRLNQARETANLAKSEIANDFPLLRSHSIMGIWGALEATIEDLAIAWMEQNPSILDGSKIAKIRIPLVEFQRLDQQERLRFLVTELQRELGVELKSGATKFESLLGALGLGGPVDERVRNILFETQNLRNVFAHRGGIADRRFVANCPHLKYSVGDAVRINGDYFQKIMSGLLMYGVTILYRCCAIAGLNQTTEEVEGFEGALSFPAENLAAVGRST